MTGNETGQLGEVSAGKLRPILTETFANPEEEAGHYRARLIGALATIETQAGIIQGLRDVTIKQDAMLTEAGVDKRPELDE